jgi:hypothetical protein
MLHSVCRPAACAREPGKLVVVGSTDIGSGLLRSG